MSTYEKCTLSAAKHAYFGTNFLFSSLYIENYPLLTFNSLFRGTVLAPPPPETLAINTLPTAYRSVKDKPIHMIVHFFLGFCLTK